MAGETVMHVVGRFTADPELRYTADGDAVANFTLATHERYFDKTTKEWVQSAPAFLRCSLWGRKTNAQEAERFAATFTKGCRVIAAVAMKPNAYEKDGVHIEGLRWEVQEIGPTFRFGAFQLTEQTA
ncbi:single-stranded DNA-binding protein [Kocuria marina]|uniref:single-stranded DNA-binding protein n=1 Tax=Kocuria marina TaxID=223184 RepID=UPI0022E41A6D|nr:single-stranded DNA-binding protein [Kocuria marina]